MAEFDHSWEFSRFQRKLWAYLDARCPIPDRPVERSQTVPELHVSIAETMVSRHVFVQGRISKKYRAIATSLKNSADLIAQLGPDTSGAAFDIMCAVKKLEQDTEFYERYFERHGRANWLARFVAEECAKHLHAATGEKLTFYFGEGNEPTTPFGRLVRDAIEFMGVRADKKTPTADGSKVLADWRRPAQDVWERFDYESLIVKDWD